MLLKTLFELTKPYEIETPPIDTLSGGSHKANDNIFNLQRYLIRYKDGNRNVEINFYCHDDELRADVYETITGLRAKASRRVSNPRARKLERTASASIPSPSVMEWEYFAEIVRQLSGNLQKNYWNRYRSNLDAPLEEIMLSSCLAQPISLQ